jgi:hypothetical protein
MQITAVKISSSSGQVGQISTEEPTSDDGFWVTYVAEDKAGNVAKAFRQVLVVCPDGEQICNANQNQQRTCSVKGKCVDKLLAAAVAGTEGAATGADPVYRAD